MKANNIRDIHVMQVGVFCHDNAEARLLISTDKNDFKNNAGRLNELGSESIVPYVNKLSAFSVKDREAMFRLYDNSSEYKGDESWLSLIEKNNGNLGRVDRVLCSGSYSDVEAIRSCYFGSKGTAFLQNWPAMEKNREDISHKHTSVVKRNERVAFERAQREFELQCMSDYSDNGKSLSDFNNKADAAESIGYDPDHFH